jgi:hypothetical protein
MAQTAWVNVSIGPGGRHTFASSGDQNAGDVTVSYDPAKMAPATVSLESVLSFIRVALQGRGFR